MHNKLRKALIVSMFVVGTVMFARMAISAAYSLPSTFVASAPVSASGQTKTYNTAGAAVYDGSIKDDGYYQTGVVMSDRNGDGKVTATDRFEDIGDGTVKDHLTGLMWMKNANLAGTKTWSAALAYVTDINNNVYGVGTAGNCGHTDWRLPTIMEICSIVDYDVTPKPYVPAGSTAIFSNVQSAIYWSSTTYVGDTTQAWERSLSTGYVQTALKTASYNIWLVRNP